MNNRLLDNICCDIEDVWILLLTTVIIIYLYCYHLSPPSRPLPCRR